MESKPRLLDQMREVLRLKHRSFRTEEAYIGWVKRFMLFHDKRHPTDMGAEEIRVFLSYSIVVFWPRRGDLISPGPVVAWRTNSQRYLELSARVGGARAHRRSRLA